MKKTLHETPEGWPQTLLVFDDGGGWSGLAIDPNDNPEAALQGFLDDMDYWYETASQILDQNADWTEIAWDAAAGCYRGTTSGTADGKHTQGEVEWTVEDLEFRSVPDDDES